MAKRQVPKKRVGTRNIGGVPKYMTALEFQKKWSGRVEKLLKIKSHQARVEMAKALLVELDLLNSLREAEGQEPLTMPNLTKLANG